MDSLFIEKGNTNGQQTQENINDLTRNEENENQNLNKMPFFTHQTVKQ